MHDETIILIYYTLQVKHDLLAVEGHCGRSQRPTELCTSFKWGVDKIEKDCSAKQTTTHPRVQILKYIKISTNRTQNKSCIQS